MKKIYTLIFFSLAVITCSAQLNFKGFVDIYGGPGVANGTTVVNRGETFSNMKPLVSFGMNITGGVQVTPNLFAGIGVGGYTELLQYDTEYYGDGSVETDTKFHSLYFPVFADVRWIFLPEKIATPYVDLKIGYQIGSSLNEGELWGYYSDESDSREELYVSYRNGFYFQPSVGFRFGKDSAFNLGVAYNMSIPRIFEAREVVAGQIKSRELAKSNTGTLLLTLGAEF